MPSSAPGKLRAISRISSRVIRLASIDLGGRAQSKPARAGVDQEVEPPGPGRLALGRHHAVDGDLAVAGRTGLEIGPGLGVGLEAGGLLRREFGGGAFE